MIDPDAYGLGRYLETDPITVAPLCNTCVHYRRKEKGIKCDAFPEGIPYDILFNKHDHHTPYPGDNGILYEPDPERT